MKEINIREDFEFSQNDTQDEGWNKVYAAWFPGGTVQDVSGTKYDIQYGIDKLISFPDGNSVGIDEKVARGTYDSFTIEYINNSVYRTIGWSFDTRHKIDYVFYKFSNGQYYNIDFKALQKYLYQDLSFDDAVEYWRKQNKYFGETFDKTLNKATLWFLMPIIELKQVGIALGPYNFKEGI